MKGVVYHKGTCARSHFWLYHDPLNLSLNRMVDIHIHATWNNMPREANEIPMRCDTPTAPCSWKIFFSGRDLLCFFLLCIAGITACCHSDFAGVLAGLRAWCLAQTRAQPGRGVVRHREQHCPWARWHKVEPGTHCAVGPAVTGGEPWCAVRHCSFWFVLLNPSTFFTYPFPTFPLWQPSVWPLYLCIPPI